MRIHELILRPLFGDPLALIFGRKSPKAVDNLDLEVVYLAGKFTLLSTYMKHSSPPYSPMGYSNWVVNIVRNQYIMVLNQLVFGTLESYFQMKAGVKSGDTEVMMAGMVELEKLFFIKKSLRNYQQSAMYRAGDLVRMPADMLSRRLRYQTNPATAFQSLDKSSPRAETKYSGNLNTPFLSNPTKLSQQGTDACMEQIIKRSKKGAKIQVFTSLTN